MHRFRIDVTIVLVAVAALTGCGASAAPPPAAPGQPAPIDEPALPPAPWSAAPLPISTVPGVYAEVWSAADNRQSCALLAPAAAGAVAGGTPRAATFSGGWAVAYDLPDTRSAFGIAGTGVAAADPAYDDWPRRLEWSDGSTAGYGPEGGTGPNDLAYLRIPGQQCLYNVWSRLGTDHLEDLLGQLRFVAQ